MTCPARHTWIHFWILTTLSTISSTKVGQCDVEDSCPIAAQLGDCLEEPCFFKLESYSQLNLTFKSPIDAETLRPSMHLKLTFVDLKLPMLEPNGCNSIVRDKCPLLENDKYNYQTQMFFPKIVKRRNMFCQNTTYSLAPYKVLKWPVKMVFMLLTDIGKTEEVITCFTCKIRFT